MYRKILLAYDGSVEGAVALREGALLAKRLGAKVFLLSVVAESGGMLMAEAAHGGAVAHQIDTYKAVLERGVARLKQLGLEPVARLVQGEPTPAIGAVATQIGADLVVIGHHRQNPIARWLSGSTRAQLSDYLTCSLLIARNPISDEAFAVELAQADRAAQP
ncbi:MAG: universal stress protein [Caulobacteraceae bacterium]|nr:universal stress protein [Caulobacteraceae bacterium]